MTDVGCRFLGLGDNPRLTTHDADARPFLRRTDRRYDLVFVDAYHQPYVPVLPRHAGVLPARARAARGPAGIVALNVATRARTTAGSADELAGTLATEFPEVADLAGAALQPAS